MKVHHRLRQVNFGAILLSVRCDFLHKEFHPFWKTRVDEMRQIENVNRTVWDGLEKQLHPAKRWKRMCAYWYVNVYLITLAISYFILCQVFLKNANESHNILCLTMHCKLGSRLWLSGGSCLRQIGFIGSSYEDTANIRQTYGKQNAKIRRT